MLGKQQSPDIVLIYTTWPSRQAAAAAGRHLVDQCHAACANIIPGVISIYEWDGSTHTDEECLMIIKTTATKSATTIEAIIPLHPYDVPAISVIEVSKGHQPFLEWVAKQTRQSNI